MKFVAIAAAAALVLSATTALAESEQPHDGTIVPTYHGGWVGPSSGEAGGGFDRAAATALYGGGHFAVTGEAGGGFDSARAVRVGAPAESEITVAATAAE